MILSGTLLLPDGNRGVRLAEGWLAVERGRVRSVGEGTCPHEADLGGPGAIVMPGFVDAHLHLPQFDVIGADGLVLLDWLEQVVYPAEARWADADFAAAMTGRVIDQLLRHGTTSFAGFSTVHHQATLRAMEVAARRNVRCLIGQTLMDCAGPGELVRPTDQLLAEAAATIEHPPGGRVGASLNPRFAVTCTDQLLAGVGQLARRTGAKLHTHFAETAAECAAVARRHGGHRYLEVYRRAGLFDGDAIVAHAVQVDWADRQALHETGAVVAHCPTANAFLRSGPMDLHAMQQGGVAVALASDVAGGPDRCMVRVARSMIDTAKSLGQPAPTPAEAFAQITLANADLLGLGQGGRLAEGAEADLLVIEPDVDWFEAPDPLGMLLYAWQSDWIRQVIVGGRVWPDAAPSARQT